VDYDSKRAEVLQALGAYQNQGAVLTDEDALEAVLADESDRGFVIILVSYIEDLLAEQILKKLKPLTTGQRKDLFRTGAALGSFTAKVNLAFALGIIDDQRVSELEIFKAMRNACAHSRKNINFNTLELKRALALLIDDSSAKVVETSTNLVAHRAVFLLASSFMLGLIAGEREEDAVTRVGEMIAAMTADAKAAKAKLDASRGRSRKRRPPTDRRAPKDKER
jgi:DNA-binding MltR family transcriptional regulator